MKTHQVPGQNGSAPVWDCFFNQFNPGGRVFKGVLQLKLQLFKVCVCVLALLVHTTILTLLT